MRVSVAQKREEAPFVCDPQKTPRPPLFPSKRRQPHLPLSQVSIKRISIHHASTGRSLQEERPTGR